MAILLDEMTKETGRLPKWPAVRKIFGSPSNDHDRALFHFELAYEVSGALRREFVLKRREIDAALADGDLGAAGHQKAMRVLAAELKARLTANVQPKLEAATQYLTALRSDLLSPPAPSDHDSMPAMLDAALRRDRAVRRYEAADATGRAALLLAARQTRDAHTLSALLSEPGLVSDERLVSALRVDIMKGHDPARFAQYAELAGTPNQQGTVDPLTSPLEIANFALNSTLDWLDTQAAPAPEPSKPLTYRGLDEPLPGADKGEGT